MNKFTILLISFIFMLTFACGTANRDQSTMRSDGKDTMFIDGFNGNFISQNMVKMWPGAARPGVVVHARTGGPRSDPPCVTHDDGAMPSHAVPGIVMAKVQPELPSMVWRISQQPASLRNQRVLNVNSSRR